MIIFMLWWLGTSVIMALIIGRFMSINSRDDKPTE